MEKVRKERLEQVVAKATNIQFMYGAGVDKKASGVVRRAKGHILDRLLSEW